MVSVSAESGLLLLYRQRLETDLQAAQLIFDIVDSCSLLCFSTAKDALVTTCCIPPCLPSSSLGSSLLSLPGSASAPPSSSAAAAPLSPVHSARGRHCLDVCISRYLEALEHARGRLERQAVAAMRAERDSGESRRETQRERDRRQRLGAGAAAGGEGGARGQQLQHSTHAGVEAEGGRAAPGQRQSSGSTARDEAEPDTVYSG